jgi:hypothetical protein
MMREYYLLMLHCHRVYFALHTTSCHQQKDTCCSLAKCYAGYHPNTHRSLTKMLHRSLPKDTPHTPRCRSLNVHFPCSPVWVESSALMLPALSCCRKLSVLPVLTGMAYFLRVRLMVWQRWNIYWW